LTAKEHLVFFCNFKEIKKKKIKENVDKIMKDLNLYDHRDTIANLLSGGNKRKLSIAISLVADSKLVILDEPTSGMDITARHRLW
jgi:ATP-binding cassette subfamily A (ABC1) protein 3